MLVVAVADMVGGKRIREIIMTGIIITTGVIITTRRVGVVDGRAVAVRAVAVRAVVADRVVVPWRAPMFLPPACSFPVIRRDMRRVP